MRFPARPTAVRRIAGPHRALVAAAVASALILPVPLATTPPAAATPSSVSAAVPRLDEPVAEASQAPEGLAAEAGGGWVRLTWSPPAAGPMPESYAVEYRVVGAPVWTTWTRTSAATATSEEVTGLTGGQTYEFQVAATNPVGTSPWAVAVTATPWTAVAPSGLLATPGDREVALTWVAPPADPAHPVVRFTVQYRTSSTDWQEWTRTGGALSVTETVTGLTNGTAYSFRVAAIDDRGTGPWTTVVTATPWTADAPTGLTAAPGDREVALTWVAPVADPDHAVQGYAVQYRAGSTDWQPWTRTGGALSVTETVTGLTNGTAYSFRVAAIDDRGTGPWTPAVTATPGRVPAVPTGLAATPGNTQVALAWQAPTDTGDLPLDGFAVQYRAAGTETWTEWPRPGRGTAADEVVTGLTNDTAYAFRVAAVNARGTGRWSTTATATPSAPRTAAGEPGVFCPVLFEKVSGKKIKNKARKLMAGTVEVPPYGWFSIANTPPSWSPQPTADLAGNRYMNSLHWALPLLYRGVRYNPEMFTRFTQLLDGWYDSHKPKTRRGNPWIDHPIYGGFRVMTYACAAQTFASAPAATDALKRRTTTRMLREASRQLNRFSVAGNNTMIHSQLGAMAAYCVVGDQPNAARAWTNLLALGDRLIRADGSDTEGAPGYGSYAVEMLLRAHAAAHTCAMPGIDPDAMMGKLAPASAFLAHATRPDFVLEPIGDTRTTDISADAGEVGPAARWTVTQGKQGSPPKDLYATFAGGYAFGRSAFAAPGEGRPSFYSVRTANGSGAHGHDDGQAVTFFGDGASWFADAGLDAYDGSAFRRYVISRRAHSVALLPGTSAATSLTSAGTNADRDRTCVSRGSSRVSHVRCVYYSRPGDFLLVADVVRAKAPTSRAESRVKPVVDQRWLLPTGVTATGSQRSWALTSGDSRATVLLSGGGQVRSAGSSSYDGWLAQKYGVRTKGALLSQQVAIPAGKWRGKKKPARPGAPRIVLTLIAPGSVSAATAARDDQGRVVATVTRPGSGPVTLTTERDLDLVGG